MWAGLLVPDKKRTGECEMFIVKVLFAMTGHVHAACSKLLPSLLPFNSFTAFVDLLAFVKCRLEMYQHRH